jgi:HPt (histidine-containing phosphotransfer) domain-containing protein
VNPPDAVNPAAIERLVKLGGGAFAAKMIGLFISYGGEKVAAARQAQSAGNLNAVADAAHPIKSSAGNVGALRVQDLAAKLEQSAREAKSDLVQSQLTELEQAFADSASFFEAEKARLAGKQV